MVLPKPKQSAKAKAVSYLARREHSKPELIRKLSKAGYSEEEAQAAIEWLEMHQLQSDERFVRSLARRRAHNYGDRAIAAELSQHGLGSSDLSDTDQADLSTEEDRILVWLGRRYLVRLEPLWLEEGSLDRDPLFKLKVKAHRALSARGFEQTNIERAWNRFIDEFISERC